MTQGSEELNKWLSEHQLTKAQAACLAYIPDSTLGEVLGGVRRIYAMHRLYFLTGLKTFELTKKEREEVESINPLSERALDIAIATLFTSRWKYCGQLATGEDALWNKKRTVHSRTMSKKYFTVENKRFVPKDDFVAKIMSASNPYEQILKDIEELQRGTPEQQRAYMKNNGDRVKNLYGVLGVLMQMGDAVKGFAALSSVAHFFTLKNERK